MGVTYLANKIAGEDRFSTSATILSMGDIKGMFGGGDSGKEEKEGFIANLESHVQQDQGILSIGLLGKNAGKLQSGGGNIDLSYSSVKQVAGDLRAISFQVSNLMDGDQGRARMTYVNTGVYSGNENAYNTAMDIFNGDKDLKFDIRENGHLGHAGDRATNDTSTIHLNWEAGKLGEDGTMNNNQLAKYTGAMSKEGAILDQVVKNNEWQKEAVLESSGLALQAQAIRDNREQMSFQVMDGVLNSLDKNLGVTMSDSTLRSNITKAAKGDMSAFDTASGDDWKLKYVLNKTGDKAMFRLVAESDRADDSITSLKALMSGTGKNAAQFANQIGFKGDVNEKGFKIGDELVLKSSGEMGITDNPEQYERLLGAGLDLLGGFIGKTFGYSGDMLGDSAKYLNNLHDHSVTNFFDKYTPTLGLSHPDRMDGNNENFLDNFSITGQLKRILPTFIQNNDFVAERIIGDKDAQKAYQRYIIGDDFQTAEKSVKEIINNSQAQNNVEQYLQTQLSKELNLQDNYLGYTLTGGTYGITQMSKTIYSDWQKTNNIANLSDFDFSTLYDKVPKNNEKVLFKYFTHSDYNFPLPNDYSRFKNNFFKTILK